MVDLRQRLRWIELQIIRPTSPALRYVVLWGLWLFVLVIITLDALDLANALKLRSVAYLLLAIVTRIIFQNWRAGVDYYPGQKNREGWIAWGLAILFAITWGQSELRALQERWNVPIAEYAPWIWVVILFVAQIKMMDFILARNNDPDRMIVKTSEGLVQVPDQRTRERMAEYLAGYLRHGMISDEKRELIREGLGFPPQSAFAERLREQARQRREAAAAADMIGVAVDLEASGEGR